MIPIETGRSRWMLRRPTPVATGDAGASRSTGEICRSYFTDESTRALFAATMPIITFDATIRPIAPIL